MFNGTKEDKIFAIQELAKLGWSGNLIWLNLKDEGFTKKLVLETVVSIGCSFKNIKLSKLDIQKKVQNTMKKFFKYFNEKRGISYYISGMISEELRCIKYAVFGVLNFLMHKDKNTLLYNIICYKDRNKLLLCEANEMAFDKYMYYYGTQGDDVLDSSDFSIEEVIFSITKFIEDKYANNMYEFYNTIPS